VSERLWDHTALDCLARCEEEFRRRYIEHMASPVPDASALFGQAVHAGVAALYAGKSVADAMTVAEQRWTAAILAAHNSLRDANLDTKSIDVQRGVFLLKPHLSAEYARAIVHMYAEELPIPKAGLLMNERYLEWSEQRICGVVDRVIEHADGSCFVHDLKTTGLYIGEKWARQWAHNLQTGGFYLDLAEHALSNTVESPGRGETQRERQGIRDEARAGVGLRSQDVAAHVVPAHREIAGVWIDAIHVDRRGYAKAEDFHTFGPFFYSAARREELRRVRHALIDRADFLVAAPVAARMETRSCFRYNSLCSFFNFCLTEPERREARYEMALESGELIHREWKPEERV
jgi:hypothetical protein